MVVVKLPDGSSHWPLTRCQLIQKSLTRIEVRLVIQGPALSAEQESKLAGLISVALQYCFDYQFVYFKGELPKTANAKFEEFVCEI
jgi:hypothetical protein